MFERRALAKLFCLIVLAASPVAAQDQQALIDLYYSDVKPELDAEVISEDLLLDSIDTFFAWNAEVQAAGYGEDLFEVDDGLVLIGRAVDFAIMQASADCVTNRDPGEAANIQFLYGLAQLNPIELEETGGEMIARYNTCAQFLLTFHSVITTRQRKDEFVSTVSGSVFLEPQAPKRIIGLWEGFPEVLKHISLTTTVKNRSRNCDVT